MPGVGGSSVVVAAALSQLGKPYIWDTPLNAADPNPRSFDCSGLSMWCYHKAGVKLGHQTNVQYRQLKHRPLSEAQPGDLVFFGTLADLYHVGIFIGNSTIVEAPDYGIPVRKRVIDGNSTGIYHKVGVFPGAQTTSGGAKPVTYREFFTTTLRDMGLPVTDANLRALARVTIIEGTNDRWNPLNSVVPSGSSQSFNSNGVQDYGSYTNGVAGTVKLLSGSAWRNVVDALRSGNSEGGVITAFANTYAGWGSHPAFGSVSDSRADSLLTQSMGNAVGGDTVYVFKTKPPYKVSKYGTAVTIGGTTYHVTDDASKFNTLSDSVITRMAHWTVTNVDAFNNGNTIGRGGFGSMDAHLWLTGKKTTKAKVVYEYMGDVYEYGSGDINIKAKGLPTGDPTGGVITNVLDGVTGWADAFGTILSWLSDAGNWKRIGLFALGAIVLIISSVEFLKG